MRMTSINPTPPRWTAALRILVSPARPTLAALTLGLGLSLLPTTNLAAPIADWAAIRESVRRGDSQTVRRAISRTPDFLQHRDEQGNSPLHLAAHFGNLETLRLLLDAGATVNATNHAGVTPLLRAAADPAKVDLLLGRGANPNLASALGHTPLMLAARCPSATESVRLLLRHGAQPNAQSRFGATALMAAAASDHLDNVRLLVESGAQVNAVPAPTEPQTDPIWGGMRTALMWAAYRGNVDIATYLIEHGADVNQVVGVGTALSQAGWRQKTDVARLLLDRGANPRQPDPFSGFTALHWATAADEGEASFVQLLLDRGADPNAPGGQPVDAYLGVPQTPWTLADRRGASPVCEILERAGARPERAQTKPTVPPASGAETSVDRLRSAIAAAMPPLQKTALYSLNSFVRHASKQDCASCHQQYLPMAATGAARSTGVPLDNAAASRLVEEVHRIERHSELDAQPLFHPEPNHTFGYALFGQAMEQAVLPEVSDSLVHHLASIQHLDGHWELNLVRPPIQSTPVTSTALGIYVLSRFGWDARGAEFEERVRRAKTWLLAQRPVTHEARVFRLLGLSWAGSKVRQLQEPMEQLLAEQRADGGWSQLPGLESDAYATGSALYALRSTGGLKLNHRAMARGVEFLLGTQGADGTWHVKRRAFPFQPTMDSGFPHGRDGWISATGTSWAVMALSALNEAPRRRESPATALMPAKLQRQPAAASLDSAPPATPIPGATVDFERDIHPLLERSCLPCHSGERPRGGYRLTDRESMLTAGSLGSPNVILGQGSESPLTRFVAGSVPDMEMPPVGKRDKFPAVTPDELQRLRAWINAGAPWPAGLKLGR
ncbi:MAG: ankyrin repeat domain-containing protein [Verrucomicrobiales bacterium]|nr:ankyrin repeat domain-containing protein [Verrucomicrobiales bacterium]